MDRHVYMPMASRIEAIYIGVWQNPLHLVRRVVCMLRRKQVPFLHRFPIAYSLVCEPRYTSRYELVSSSHAYVCYHMIHAVLVGGQNR